MYTVVLKINHSTQISRETGRPTSAVKAKRNPPTFIYLYFTFIIIDFFLYLHLFSVFFINFLFCFIFKNLILFIVFLLH